MSYKKIFFFSVQMRIQKKHSLSLLSTSSQYIFFFFTQKNNNLFRRANTGQITTHASSHLSIFLQYHLIKKKGHKPNFVFIFLFKISYLLLMFLLFILVVVSLMAVVKVECSTVRSIAISVRNFTWIDFESIK
jgi:hypothetical protein